MSAAVTITAIICLTLVTVSIFGKPDRDELKTSTYLYNEDGKIREVKNEYK